MKMMTGVMPKETMEISEILASDLYGQTDQRQRSRSYGA